jgi:predicted HTH transcriptional regulator
MTTVIIFISGIFLGGLLMLLFVARREAKKHGTSIVEEAVGICSAAFERTAEKEMRKQQALAFLLERGEAGNKELREALGVSAATAVRYMTELEEEGKVEQSGTTGTSVVYRPTARP